MLRLMQIDLMDKTEAFEEETGRVRRDGRRLPADRSEEAQRLSDEQRRLIELALEMVQRDNDPDAVDPNQGE